jgi:colicin import membrane protein
MAYALPLKNDFLREHSAVLAASVALHLLLLIVLSLNLDIFPRRQPPPSRLAIQATVVDGRALRQASAREERRQREALQLIEQRRRETVERQRLEQERRQAEQQKVATQSRLAEQKRQEQAEARRLEESRRADEAAKATKARAEQQRREAEQQKLAAAEAKTKADAERRRAQTKADLARQMAEEEDLLAAQDSGLLDQYAEVIRQKVERNWIRPASAREGINCAVLVRQIPGGDVVDVRVAECNGDAAVVRSIEAAVLRSSPLPPPPDPTLFDRSLRFDFRPRD